MLGEGELSRAKAPITLGHLRKVKTQLLSHPISLLLTSLIYLNNVMHIYEALLALLDDSLVDHSIPHLWVHNNNLTDRKANAGIRYLLLLEVS